MFLTPFPNRPGKSSLFLEIIELRNKENTELCVSSRQREDPRGIGHTVVSCTDLKGLQEGKQIFFELFFVDRSAAVLVQGPDLGMELIFPQER